MRLIKFQNGGMVAAPAPEEQIPSTPEQGVDPMAQIVEAFVAGLQNQDCSLLAQGAQMFLQLVQEAQGGAPGAPAEGQPVFAKGGKLVSRKPVSLQLVRK